MMTAMSAAASPDITMGEMGRTVARIEHKLDQMVEDHEKRIRTIEKWMWGLAGLGGAGAASGVGALIQALASS